MPDRALPLAWRLACVALLDFAVLAIYAGVSGRGSILIPAAAHSLLFALALTVLARLLWRRVIMAGGAVRLRHLARDAGLGAGLLSLAHAALMFNSGLLAPEPERMAALSPGYVRLAFGWYLVVYAALYGVFVFALVGDLVARVRLRAAQESGPGLPPGDGSLLHRLGFSFGIALGMPALLLLFDFTWLLPVRAAQGLAPAEVVLLDVLAAAVILSVTLGLLLRGVLRSVGLLERGQRALAAGGGSAVPVVSDDELGRLADGFNAMRSAVREREFLRTAFSAYVGEDACHRMLESGNLAPRQHEATILFTDIAGFTGISESKTPPQLLDLLREYFAMVVSVVERRGGHVDNFIGDAIIAVFNIDGLQVDHAARALAAAREIAALTRTRRFGGELLTTRVGLHSGPVASGEVGSDTRRGHSVFGDTVNVASRLESENKRFGTTVLASEAVILACGGSAGFEYCGEAELRGRRVPIRVFGLRDGPDAAG